MGECIKLDVFYAAQLKPEREERKSKSGEKKPKGEIKPIVKKLISHIFLMGEHRERGTM